MVGDMMNIILVHSALKFKPNQSNPFFLHSLPCQPRRLLSPPSMPLPCLSTCLHWRCCRRTLLPSRHTPLFRFLRCRHSPSSITLPSPCYLQNLNNNKSIPKRKLAYIIHQWVTNVLASACSKYSTKLKQISLLIESMAKPNPSTVDMDTTFPRKRRHQWQCPMNHPPQPPLAHKPLAFEQLTVVYSTKKEGSSVNRLPFEPTAKFDSRQLEKLRHKPWISIHTIILHHLHGQICCVWNVPHPSSCN